MNEIISLVILVGILVSIASLSYVFVSNTLTGKVSEVFEFLYIEANKKIVVRNIGQNNINEINVYMDGEKKIATLTPFYEKLSYFGFNEGNGTITKDVIKDKTANLINNPKWVKTNFGYGLEFSGNSYVELTNFNLNFSNYQKLVFSARVYTNKDQTQNDWNYFIHIKDEYEMPIVEFGTWGNEIVFKVFSSYTGYDLGYIPIEKDKWIFVAGIVEGNNVKLYINGNLVASRNDFPGFTSSPINRFYIGGWQTRIFDGIIDEIGIFTNFEEGDSPAYANGILPPGKIGEIYINGIINGRIKICTRNYCQPILYSELYE
ncbi:MAG: LamG domain-containing protein [Candidatus Aenigmatarchaeota archaeon]